MRPRKQMNIVEMMIVMAIIGIVAAVVLPNLKQAKQRALAARSAPVQQPTEPDGQLNTIELSETADRGTTDQWGRALAPLFPLAFIAVVILVIFVAMRQQMSRHAKQ